MTDGPFLNLLALPRNRFGSIEAAQVMLNEEKRHLEAMASGAAKRMKTRILNESQEKLDGGVSG